MFAKIYKNTSFIEKILLLSPIITIFSLGMLNIIFENSGETSLLFGIVFGCSSIISTILFVWMFVVLLKNKQLRNKKTWIIFFLFFTYGAAMIYLIKIKNEDDITATDATETPTT